MPTISPSLVFQLTLIAVVFFSLQISAAVLVYFERKISGWAQQRVGPNRVGPLGLLQPLADIVKLIFKEELRPKAADKWLFYLAPVLSATTAFAAFAVIPFGPPTTFFGLLEKPVPLQVADLNVAVLVVFAITSMGIYGIVLAGWASNSKYALLGGLRSSAQMISYELAYGMALASVLVIANTLSLREIVDKQAGVWWLFNVIPVPAWYVFLAPVGFFIFFVAGIAETNRAPFDFPEAEQELVAGYHTEYSSMSFALFFLAEYVNMVVVCGVTVSLFLGGFYLPGPARLAGAAVVPRQARGAAVLLHLDAVDAAALPLRPADGLRLEAAAAALDRQPAGDCGRRSLLELRSWPPGSSTSSPPSRSVSSLGVIGQRNPMYSVLLLIGSFISLAGLYVGLDSPFVAVTQIVVYAGAIMVLFLFVVMLLNAPREDVAPGAQLPMPGGVKAFGALLALGMAAMLAVGAQPARRGAVRRRSAGRGARRLGARHRHHAVPRPRVLVRGHLDPHPRRHGRRRGAGQEDRLRIDIRR